MIYIHNIKHIYNIFIISYYLLWGKSNTYASEETSGSGALASTNVEPASLVANASGNIVITFTTASAIPADGKIKVIFPIALGSGFTFDNGGTTAVTTSSNITGTFSVATSGNIVTITRANDGSSSTAGAKSITLSYIKNPNTTGSTGTYQIITTNSSGTVIDQDNAVTADTITSSTLSSTNIEPASLSASTASNVTVSFTTSNTIPYNGKIVLTFPTSLGSGFSFGTLAVSSASGIDGSFTVSNSSNVVTITRTGTGNGSTAGAKSLILTGITSPSIGGSTGTYQIKTTNSSGTTIDENASVTSDNILGTLTSVNVEPASLVAGAVGNTVITFTTASAIPADGKIVLTLPTSLGSGFTFNSGGTTAVSASSGFTGTFTVSISSNTITLTRANDGSSSSAGAKSITLSYIKNPEIPGSTGTYSLYSKTSADITLEQHTTITADTISVGSLTSTNVEPASLVAGATGNITVTFTNSNPIPNNGKIIIYLPSSLGTGYVLDSNGTTDLVSKSGIDGTVTVSETNNYITIVRNGDGSSSSAGVKSIVLSNIKNPDISGSTDVYTIDTRNSSSIAIDQDLSVTADTITSGSISSANIEPSSLVAEAVGNTAVSFNPANPIPITGKIIITLPSGFTIDSGGTTVATSNTIDGTLTVSNSSNIITIVRSGGTTASAGTSHSITLNYIKNPNTAGSTGSYSLKTTNSADITIDENTSISADTITAIVAAAQEQQQNNSSSGGSSVQSRAIIATTPTITEQITNNFIISTIKNIIGLGIENNEYPPIVNEQLENSEVFNGKLDLITNAKLKNLVFSPLPFDLKTIFTKFPQLENTLKTVGINNEQDITKLVNVRFSLPEISSLVGDSSENIPIPIKDLTLEMRKNIPSEVVFLRSADEKVDLSVNMTVTDKGEIRQTLDLIEGQDIKLFIKPEGKPDRISGIIELYSKKVFGKTSVPLSSIVASVFFANPKIAKEAQSIDTKLVLERFEYSFPAALPRGSM